MRFFTNEHLVAVDFDSRHLRIVQAEPSGGRARVLKMVETPVPAGLDIADAKALGELLGKTLAGMGLAGAALLMDVPRGQVVLKPLTLPPGARRDELANMVQYQVEKDLPMRPDEAVIDFAVERDEVAASGAGAAGKDAPPAEVQVLVAAVPKPVVEYYRQITASAGAKLRRLGLRPYANMRCTQALADPATPGIGSPGALRALVHITADETEIDVIAGSSLAFSRAAAVKMSPDADEAALVQAVVSEVHRTLQSFTAMEGGQAVQSLLVAGGTGIEAAVVNGLARRLAVPCKVFNPASMLGLPGATARPAAFISALGLVLGHRGGRETRAQLLPFDFLDPKRPAIQRDMRRIRRIAIGSAAALLLVALVSGQVLHLRSLEARLADLRAQNKELSDKNKGVVTLARRVKALDAWVAGSRSWLDQWALLSGIFPPADEAYITNLKSSPDGSMSFVVRARSNDAITALGKRLQEAGYDFKPGQVSTSNDAWGYPFRTEVKALVKAGMKVDLAGYEPPLRPADDVSLERVRRSGGEPRAGEQPGAGQRQGGRRRGEGRS